jgi:AsmA-like C-terminal region
MRRALRVVLAAAVSLAVLFAIAFGLAWAFLPREWIAREAQRQASQIAGADVRWKRLTPGFQWLSLGVRIEGLVARMPASGPAAVDARVGEIFVRFKLLPLLLRRVEVSAASVRHGSITLVDRGTPSPAAGGPRAAPGGEAALVLPRIEFSDLSVRTRDPLGGGFDLKGIEGSSRMGGALPAIRDIEMDVQAESLYWKPSAKDPRMALPGPARLSVSLAQAGGGARLAVTRGTVELGPLRSALTGGVDMPKRSGEPAGLALRLRGEPQPIRSDDAAFRPLTSGSPARFFGTATWDVRIGGTSAAPVSSGTMTLNPLQVEAEKNEFKFDRLAASWTTAADQTFTAKAEGSGIGIDLTLEAEGSTRPGGATRGVLFFHAPAARLNGIVPDAPTWQSGDLECRAVFQLHPPAPPDVRWTVRGRGLSGTVPGVAHPLKGFDFQIEGDPASVTVRSMQFTAGSTTARVTGTVKQGKPLGTGTFRIDLDRVVAEEWAPPRAEKGAPAAPRPAATSTPPIPLRQLTGTVTVREVRSGGMVVRDVVAPVRLEGGSLSVEPVRGRIGSGSIDGRLDVRSLFANPHFDLKLDITRAPVQEVAAGILPFRSPVSGFLNGSVSLDGPGLPGPEVVDSLRGSLSGTVDQGEILPSPTIAQLTSALGLKSAGDLAFRTISHTLRIEGGRLIVDKVKGDLGTDRFDLTGGMGLDQSLGLTLHVSLAPSRLSDRGTLGSLASYARDAEGRIPLDVRIGGTVLKPVVQVQAGKALEAAGQKLRQSLTQELTKSLSRSAAPDTARGADSARAGADSAVATPLEKGKEALKRLLGR